MEEGKGRNCCVDEGRVSESLSPFPPALVLVLLHAYHPHDDDDGDSPMPIMLDHSECTCRWDECIENFRSMP